MSKLGHYDYHPAYRGDAYWVAQDEEFGRDRNQVPTQEMEVGRGGPWFTGQPEITLTAQGCNPVGAIFEPLTDDMFGAGFAESMLDFESFDAVRSTLATANFKISVLQTDQVDLRSYLSEVLEYFDGFLYRKGSTIALGYWPQGDIDTDVLPVVGSDDLTSEPRLRSLGMDDCYTEVNVIFCDREHYFHDAVATYRNPGLQRTLGEFRAITLNRKFITDAVLAQQYATQWAQKYVRPGMTGELDVKLEKVEAIEGDGSIIGKLIKTDSASLGWELVFRIVECEYPADDGPFFCTLTVELERSIWPEIFIQPPPKRIGNFIVNVPAIKNFALWELPSGLKNKAGIQIGLLAQRPSKSIIGFNIWTSPANVIYDELTPSQSFAAYGKIVDVDYLDTRPNPDTTIGMHVILFGVDLVPTQTNPQRDDYNWLAFVGVPGVAPFPEILSVGQVVALGSGKYKIFTRSALYGTGKHFHGIDSKVFFIKRDRLFAVSNKTFIKDATLWFKLQPFDNHQTFDLASVVPFQHALSGGAVGVPTSLTLTTTFAITTERTVDARILASWTHILDQDITGFDVRCRRLAFDAIWVTIHVGVNVNNQMFKMLEPNKLYEVQVRATSWTGDFSDWTPSEQIVTAAPNIPGIPTGFNVEPVVGGAFLTWNNAATSGIAGTIILFSLISGDDIHMIPIDRVARDQTSYTKLVDDFGSFLFFSVRHVNTLEVEGARTTSQAVVPLDEAPLVKLPPPFIAKATGEAGTAGDADYRLQIVNTSAGQTAILEFSYNKTTWFVYSETGNYQDGLPGSVLPTGDIGAISLSAGGQLFARQKKPGFLMSDIAAFYNNTSKTPHEDGSGGGDGTPGKNLP